MIKIRLLLVIILIVNCAGCLGFEFPTQEHRFTTHGREPITYNQIRQFYQGGTAEDVLLILGEPDFVDIEIKSFEYRWEVIEGYGVALFIAPIPIRKTIFLFIRFDENWRFKSYELSSENRET